MTQVSSYIIPESPRAALRTGFNAILEALRDLNAGTTPPENPVPFMVWMDTSTTPSTLRMRNAANDGWGLMVDVMSIYHPANVLGTVSQAGGVPTGAIFETGSNASARWTKYADGTMIIAGSFSGSVAVATSYAGFWRASPLVVTFPQVFAVAPFLVAGNDTVTGMNGVISGAMAITATDFTMMGFRSSSLASTPFQGHYTAIGRWI